MARGARQPSTPKRSAPHRDPCPAPRRLGHGRARHRPAARLPPARPDRDRRDTAGARPLEPPRRVRPRASSTGCSGRSGRSSSGTRSLADRVAADRARADAALADVDALRARSAGCTASWPRTARSGATSSASSSGAARCSRASSRTARPAAPRSPLVRVAARRPHAHDPPPLGRDRGRRAPGPAAPLGSRRARLSAGRGADARRRPERDARRAALPLPRCPARQARLGGASGRVRRAGARPRRAPLALRPARPRPRPGGGALRLPLPARDVRAARETRVRLLRPPASRRRPHRRPGGAGRRPEKGTMRLLGAWGDTSRLDEALDLWRRSSTWSRSSTGGHELLREVRQDLAAVLGDDDEVLDPEPPTAGR